MVGKTSHLRGAAKTSINPKTAYRVVRSRPTGILFKNKDWQKSSYASLVSQAPAAARDQRVQVSQPWRRMALGGR